MDGLPPTIHIDEALSSTQMDELLLYTLTSPSLQLRWTGSHYNSYRRSSSLNSDGRAPTIHTDEPFAATQMDRLPPTIHIDEALPSTQMDELLLYTQPSPSLQLRWTGSHLQFILTKLFPQPRWTSSYCTL